MDQYCCKLFQELCHVGMGVGINVDGKVTNVYWCDGYNDEDLTHLRFKVCPYCQEEFN